MTVTPKTESTASHFSDLTTQMHPFESAPDDYSALGFPHRTILDKAENWMSLGLLNRPNNEPITARTVAKAGLMEGGFIAAKVGGLWAARTAYRYARPVAEFAELAELQVPLLAL